MIERPFNVREAECVPDLIAGKFNQIGRHREETFRRIAIGLVPKAELQSDCTRHF